MNCGRLWAAVWLWLAMDADTRLIVSCAIGPRDKETADDLWYGLPPEYGYYHPCGIDSGRSALLISTMSTPVSCPLSGTKRLAKKLAKLLILNVSTTPFASVVAV